MQALDEKRHGLDIEIHELMSEMDTEASFADANKQKAAVRKQAGDEEQDAEEPE